MDDPPKLDYATANPKPTLKTARRIVSVSLIAILIVATIYVVRQMQNPDAPPGAALVCAVPLILLLILAAVVWPRRDKPK